MATNENIICAKCKRKITNFAFDKCMYCGRSIPEAFRLSPSEKAQILTLKNKEIEKKTEKHLKALQCENVSFGTLWTLLLRKYSGKVIRSDSPHRSSKFLIEHPSGHILIEHLASKTRVVDSESFDTARFNTTRFCAEHSHNPDFYFEMHPKKLGLKILRFLGIKDINIGSPLVDRKFFIKSNNREKLINVIRTEEIINSLIELPEIYIFLNLENSFLGKLHPSALTPNNLCIQIDKHITDFNTANSIIETLLLIRAQLNKIHQD